MNLKHLFAALVLALMSLGALPVIAQQVLTGDAAFTDYTKEQPGVRRKVTDPDLPQPYATPSANTAPVVSPRPDGAMLHTFPGFKVKQFATGLNNPRLMRMAPNGDIFLAESEPGKDHRDSRHRRRRQSRTDGDVRHRPEGRVRNKFLSQRPPIRNGSMLATPHPWFVFLTRWANCKARGPAQTLTELPGGGGHRTRDIVFTPDGKHMLVSVGSHSNVDDPDTTPAEVHRADVLEFTPEGKFEKAYAYGIRNCVAQRSSRTPASSGAP